MDLTQDQVRTFVGPNADYYFERWHRVQPEGSRALGFNWPAFFLTISWLLYRRMYRWFWITIGGFIAIWAQSPDRPRRARPTTRLTSASGNSRRGHPLIW